MVDIIGLYVLNAYDSIVYFERLPKQQFNTMEMLLTNDF